MRRAAALLAADSALRQLQVPQLAQRVRLVEIRVEEQVRVASSHVLPPGAREGVRAALLQPPRLARLQKGRLPERKGEEGEGEERKQLGLGLELGQGLCGERTLMDKSSVMRSFFTAMTTAAMRLPTCSTSLRLKLSTSILSSLTSITEMLPRNPRSVRTLARCLRR